MATHTHITASTRSSIPEQEVATTVVATLKSESALAAMLDRQRAAFLRDGPPSLTQRRSDLMKLKEAVQERRKDFVAAINAEFGKDHL